MKRRAGFLAFVTVVLIAGAVLLHLTQTPEERELAGELTIYSSTDDMAFRPVLDDFRKFHPGIRIDYVELGTQELNSRFLAESAKDDPRADLLLSSAMDLQAKLVNDGFARRPDSIDAAGLKNFAPRLKTILNRDSNRVPALHFPLELMF